MERAVAASMCFGNRKWTGEEVSVRLAGIGPKIAAGMRRLDLGETAKDPGLDPGAIVGRRLNAGRRGVGLRPNDRRVLEQAGRIFRRRIGVGQRRGRRESGERFKKEGQETDQLDRCPTPRPGAATQVSGQINSPLLDKARRARIRPSRRQPHRSFTGALSRPAPANAGPSPCRSNGRT